MAMPKEIRAYINRHPQRVQRAASPSWTRYRTT